MNHLRIIFKELQNAKHREIKESPSVSHIQFKADKATLEIEENGKTYTLPIDKNDTGLDTLLGHDIFKDRYRCSGKALLELETDEVKVGENITFWKDMSIFRHFIDAESKWCASGYSVGPNINRKLNGISNNLTSFITEGEVLLDDKGVSIICTIKLPIMTPKSQGKDTDKLITAVNSGLLPKSEALVAGVRSNDNQLVEFLVNLVEGDASKCGVEFQSNGEVARFHNMKGNKNLLGLFNPSVELLLYLAGNDLGEGVSFQEAQGITWKRLPTQYSYGSQLTKGLNKLALYLTPTKLELKGKPLTGGLGEELIKIAANESANFSYISPIVKVLLEAGADLEYGVSEYSKSGQGLALKRALLELPEHSGKYFKNPLPEIKAGILASDEILNSLVAKAEFAAATPTADIQEIDLF